MHAHHRFRRRRQGDAVQLLLVSARTPLTAAPPLRVQVVYYEGSYAEYEEYKANVLGEEVGQEFEHSKLKM